MFRNNKSYITKFIYISLLTALATVLTMIPQIPTGTGGYVHFGDSIIYITAVFFGPFAGMAVGGIGHSLADLFSGYSIFIIPTLIIKGLMGFTAGAIAKGSYKGKRIYIALIAGGVIVTLGYFLAEIPMFGIETAKIALISSPIQWIMSIIASIILFPMVNKILSYLR